MGHEFFSQPALRAEAKPAAVLGGHYTRGLLELSRGHDADVPAAFQAVAGFGDRDRDCVEMGIATAVLRLAQDDPRGALAALVPVLDGCAPLPAWMGRLLRRTRKQHQPARGPSEHETRQSYPGPAGRWRVAVTSRWRTSRELRPAIT